MKSEALLTGGQGSYLRDKIFILSVVCPFDQGNPCECPFHETEKRNLNKRMEWLNELSEEAILNFDTYCGVCWEENEKLE